jgi:hypothetical protein
MTREAFAISALLSQRHSPVRNYVIPGLTSWLIGGQTEGEGVLRLFECDREQQESIAPHSHRFDFNAWVLRGEVENRVWRPLRETEPERFGDLYRSKTLVYRGQIGDHEALAESPPERWCYEPKNYRAGDTYGMRASEVHSIIFWRNTLVLFHEGPTVSDGSIVLEPVCYGKTVPTFKVEPWMFQRNG